MSLDQVSKEQRDFAKRLNFGVVYGIGAQRFALMTGLGVPEAENVLRRYFGTYRGLDTYLREAANPLFMIGKPDCIRSFGALSLRRKRSATDLDDAAQR